MSSFLRIFGALSAMTLVACAAPDDEFDRRPVVKSVETGPFRHRFYASPSSTGGAATRFRHGETVYLVNTLEVTTRNDVVCSFELEGYWGLGTCGNAIRRVLRGDDVVWDDGPKGLCFNSAAVETYPESFTVPGMSKERYAAKVNPRNPLARGKYTVDWLMGLYGVGLVPSVCGFSYDSTYTTLEITIE